MRHFRLCRADGHRPATVDRSRGPALTQTRFRYTSANWCVWRNVLESRSLDAAAYQLWASCSLHNCTSANPLEFTGNYSATSKLVHWPLMGWLLHLVQWGGDWAGSQLAQAPPRCTKCNSPRPRPSTANVSVTVLLYNGPLLCGFSVAVKGLSSIYDVMKTGKITPELIMEDVWYDVCTTLDIRKLTASLKPLTRGFRHYIP